VLEEAAAYQQLIEEFGQTHDQVATRVGRSRAGVTNTLRLLQLPAGAQRLLAEGQITAGHARALLGTPDRGYQESLAKRAAGEGLTVRAVEDLVRQHDERAAGRLPADGDNGERPSDQSRDRRLPPPGILELEELLSSHLNTRVKVDLSSKRGKVVVEFATLEDLERIYTLMVGRAETA
jgi:ParB family transcriptional regulator, chromosome partitioning protein